MKYISALFLTIASLGMSSLTAHEEEPFKERTLYIGSEWAPSKMRSNVLGYRWQRGRHMEDINVSYAYYGDASIAVHEYKIESNYFYAVNMDDKSQQYGGMGIHFVGSHIKYKDWKNIHDRTIQIAFKIGNDFKISEGRKLITEFSYSPWKLYRNAVKQHHSVSYKIGIGF